MRDLLRPFWLAVRNWPFYTGLAVLGLAIFAWAGLASHRLLGDDNESGAPYGAGPRGAPAHGGAARFYHK
jgi:hypothetical protein